MTTRIALHKILPALLTACLALGVSAGAAQAQFQLPAFDVTEDGANYGAIATTDSVGGTHFMWYRNSTGMQTRKRGVDGTLGPVQTIAGTATTNNALAADQAGNVQFVWRTSGGSESVARTRRLHANGTLGSTLDLSAPGFYAANPRVAFDAAGAGVFMWTRSLDTGTIVQARRMAADGALGPVQNISQAGDVGANQVAVDDEGNAVLVWTRWDGSFSVAQARRWSADGTLGPIVDITSTGAPAEDPRVGIDAAGIAHFAVIRAQTMMMRRMSVGGVLSPAQVVQEFPGDNSHDPWLAVDRAGNAQVVWRVTSVVNGNVIQTRQEFPDGTYGPVQTVSEYNPFELSPLPRVALDAHGNAHYVWLAMADSHKVVRARSRGSDGSLGDIQQLSAPGTGSTGNASDPSIATGANGQPVAAWTRMSESGLTLVHGAVLVPQPETESGGTSGGAGGGSGTSGDAGGTGIASEPDRLAPKLSGLVLKPAKLVVRRRGRVAYALTEPSTVTLRVVRRGARRRVVGALRATGSAGRNSLMFRGRLRGRYLRPGRYQLVAVATDRAGNRSATSRARFRVVRR